MINDFKDKTVAITGGATGIGFALAKAMGEQGARIVIGEPRENRLSEAVEALGKLGIGASSMVMDVTDPDSVEAFADFAWDAFGSVHVLINNAGIGAPRKSVTELRLDALHKAFDVNVFGVWHGCASFGRRMIEQGEPAAIYNLGSENSFFVAVPQSAAYVATKHAVLGMTESLREEMPDFISVGIIIPGWVRSELTAGDFAKYAMDADEYAAIVVKQIKAGEFYIVSHGYNVERIKPLHEARMAAYAKYAPRYDGDDEYDVRTVVGRIMGGG